MDNSLFLLILSGTWIVLLLVVFAVFFWFLRKNDHDQQKHHITLQTMQTQLMEGLINVKQQVNQQLQDGLDKSAHTFSHITQRLVMIDEAQKKMADLSSTVINLQNILSNKSARGILGEVQLSALIQNMLPAAGYALQYTLSNGRRADCMLFLPQPSGNIVIDAKFPFENYQRIASTPAETPEHEKTRLHQQFRYDIKKHIHDIRDKYIIPNETATGAVMFIPAESIFAEIHANYPDLIQHSHTCNVWLASPTTLMAILTTARAVLKDDATRLQVHVIQDHLKSLAQDFKRFETRMQNLTRYLQKANDEASDVNISAQKITGRFEKIDQLDLKEQVEEVLLS